MSTTERSINDTRERIETDLLAKFGEAFEQAAKQTKSISDPARRELGAARIALEHAILQTALEKDLPSKTVTALLEKSSPQQVAQFIKEGRKSIQRTYGVEADAMVAALSAKVANVDLLKGLAQTDSMRQLIEKGRGLVHQAVTEKFNSRGTFTDGSPRHEQLNLRTSFQLNDATKLLKNHMVFVESAIDHSVKSGRLNVEQGELLKARIENQIFNVPAEHQKAAIPKEFRDVVGTNLRTDIMKEARQITRNETILQIAERLQAVRQRVQSRMEPERT